MKLSRLILIVALMFFCSCEIKSSLSEGKVEDLSLIGAEFKISTSNNQDVFVSGNLYDKDGKAIDNDSIQIKVNNIDLILGKIPGMGLNDYEYRSYDKIPVSDNYNFEIVLTNGKKHFLGSIKPIEKINENDIVCNEVGDLNKDCFISWHNLKEYNELEIIKSFQSLKPDSTNNYSTSSKDDIKKINSNGKYIIPKTEYSNDNIPINFIVFNFKASKLGTINPDLIKGSKITNEERVEKMISFSFK
jgi:hypothetical protein